MNAETKSQFERQRIVEREFRRWMVGEGKSLSDARSLPRDGGQHLENRLWRAFQAGAKSAEKAILESPSTLQRMDET